jgi:hypothetical protein
MTKIIRVCLVSFLCLIGCRHTCMDNHITPVFIGFSPADIDTFIIRQYKPNDNFLHLIDTVTISTSSIGIYTTTNDTITVFVNTAFPKSYINPGFDWQIYIPAKNRIISISNIVSNPTEGSGRACFNPINSFVENGQIVAPQLTITGSQYTSGYLAYINNP